jgi:CheY-like chemotaxis protein
MSWVLVVDDEAGMRDLLKWFLISRGHAVSTAAGKKHPETLSVARRQTGPPPP